MFQKSVFNSVRFLYNADNQFRRCELKRGRMHLDDFLTEQWMNEHENDAVYNMTDTCVKPLTLRELFAMDTDGILQNVVLDYGTITGDVRLKQEILKLYQGGTTDSLTLTHGCLAANELVMYTFLNPGDRVVSFTPGYQQFTSLPESFGCRVHTIPLKEENGWMPDDQDLEEAFREEVRMLIINNPNNPTGTFFDRDMLEKLIRYCRKYDAILLSDEVYRGRSPQEVPVSDLYEYGISTGSLSKLFSLAGIRLGWIKADEKLIRMLNVRRDYSFISTGPLADAAALIALKQKEQILKRSEKIIADNKAVYRKWLAEMPYASLVMPSYGPVGFLRYEADEKDVVLAQKLLRDHGVFFVPGSCFGMDHHFRIGFTRDVQETKSGLAILGSVLRKANEKMP